MTSNWKECKLGDIVDINMGQSPKSEYYNNDEIGFPFLQGNRTFGAKYPLFDTYTTKPTKIANIGDVIMSVRAPVGELNIILDNICIGRGVCALRMKNQNQEFLYYLMKYYSKQLINKESGTVFGSINRNDIFSLEVNIPEDLECQQKIAKVLGAIDDKIELNNSINNNLEQQIKALYNHCFTNKNNVVEISNLIDVRDGTHDSPKPQFKGKKLITSKHLLKYGVDISSANFITEEDYQKINERSLVATDDILISMIGTVGIVSYIIENPVDFAVKNVGIYRTSQKKEYAYYVHCFLNSTETQNYILSHLAGTTQKYISLSELRSLKINVPTQNELKVFNKFVEPIYNNLISNTNENICLIHLRDTLLPKLMSGEIDVSNIEIDEILDNIFTDKLSFGED